MIYSLTTSRKTIIESASTDRIFLLSAGLFDAANTIYIRFKENGSPDAMIWRDGNNQLRLNVPKGATVYAFTDAGTAKIAVLKEGHP